MALIVPILRIMMLLLNIYETFKVLKRPRASPRNSGQPTVRALSQRKRNMKGCLAVWIVWCCFMTYERMAEGIVSLFIPFYDEFKSLVLLFLILTRARGAEPIYLHIIRPLLKPYTSTVDAIFDVARMFGDIAFLLSTYPFHLVATWWHNTFNHSEAPVEQEANDGMYAEVQQALQTASYQVPVQPTSRRRSSGPIRDGIQAASTFAAEQNTVCRPRVSTELTEGFELPVLRHAHEIWHPPRSSYQDEDDDHANSIIPPSFDSDLESEETRREREQMEEWRQYPPFPSAYPPTPLHKSASGLPPRTLHDASSFAPRTFSPIPEDMHQLEQDFGQSLPSPHELANPGSVGDSSDEADVLGIQTGVSNMATAFQDDTMDDDDDEEDDFNVTLRTPGSLVVPDTITARLTRSKTKEALPASNPSLDPPLPGLPSLLPRISSDTSSVSSDSSTTSLVGRKRSRDFIVAAHLPETPRGRKRISVPKSDIALEDIEDESSVASSSSTSETDGDADADTSVSEPKSPLVKRRRVASPPSRVQPRRTTRTASHEPPVVPPPPRPQRQRQPKAQNTDAGGGRTSSRLASAVDTAPRRGIAADLDGPFVASKSARPSRRAPGGNALNAKRK
ncbi:hypothetical protein C8R43DRAFT_231562 [Mycena crocata]|nr:hypothetical protein C8R43DRAFT_231562 [Mycena crocata]